MEDFLKLLRQGKIEVSEMELVPHMDNYSDGVVIHTILSGRYTLRILYKEIK